VIPKLLEADFDTLEEFKEKLGVFYHTKYLKAINLILTRRHLPGCFQFSNGFIAQETVLPDSEIEALNAIQFRPLQNMFDDTETECESCRNCDQRWKMNYPWTGTEMIKDLQLPITVGCRKANMPIKAVKIFNGSKSQWIFSATDSQISMIVHRTATGFRMYISGFPNIERFQECDTEKEMIRKILFLRYLCSSSKDHGLSEGSLTDNDPYLKLIRSDDWKTTPSLQWNQRMAEADAKIHALVVSRQESIKIVNLKFKEQIEACGSIADFMEQYYPRTNIIALAAMCRVSEQPA